MISTLTSQINSSKVFVIDFRWKPDYHFVLVLVDGIRPAGPVPAATMPR